MNTRKRISISMKNGDVDLLKGLAETQGMQQSQLVRNLLYRELDRLLHEPDHNPKLRDLDRRQTQTQDQGKRASRRSKTRE